MQIVADKKWKVAYLVIEVNHANNYRNGAIDKHLCSQFGEMISENYLFLRRLDPYRK